MPKSQQMDNINVETRKKQLDNLKHFILLSLEKTNSIINFMGWDVSKVLEVSVLVYSSSTYIYCKNLFLCSFHCLIIKNSQL